MEVSAAHQGSSQYQAEAAIKHGERVILHVNGPVTAALSSKKTHIETQLRVAAMNGSPYTVTTAVIFAPNKQKLALDLLSQQQRIVAIEWNMAAQSNEETHIDFKLELPTLIKKSVNVVISEKLLHLSFDQLVRPKSSPQSVKGFVDIDYESKRAQAQLSWDADRSPNKKIKAEAMIVGGSSTLENSLIQ